MLVMNSITGALLRTLWKLASVNDHPRSSKFVAQHSEPKGEERLLHRLGRSDARTGKRIVFFSDQAVRPSHHRDLPAEMLFIETPVRNCRRS
jgi:hypothetical protein